MRCASIAVMYNTIWHLDTIMAQLIHLIWDGVIFALYVFG